MKKDLESYLLDFCIMYSASDFSSFLYIRLRECRNRLGNAPVDVVGGEDLLRDVSAEAAVEPRLPQVDLRLRLRQQVDHLFRQYLVNLDL